MLCPEKIQSTACQSGTTTGDTKNYQQNYLRLQSETPGTSNRTIKKWQNSTSSGYASHSSPPLSASVSGGFYSTCYASASSATKLIDPGLSIIHETDIPPRPIWPYLNYNSHTNHWVINLNDNDYQYNGKLYSNCHNNSALICRDCFIRQSINNKAKSILLELSSKLNSIIDGNNDITAEEILEDISKIIEKGIENSIGENNDKFEVRNQCDVDDIDNTLNTINKKMKNLIGNNIVNPVNHRLYEKSGQLNYNPWLTKLNTKNHVPDIMTMPRCSGISSINFLDDIYHGKNKFNDVDLNKNCEITKSKGGNNKICYTNDEPVYTTLDPSDESSSYGIISPSLSSTKRDWNDGVMVFNKNMDFTLDGVRAERLECAIARAKSRRKWCRIIITIFGLVFFILSVIIVTMSVTRGRKIFGSM